MMDSMIPITIKKIKKANAAFNLRFKKTGKKFEPVLSTFILFAHSSKKEPLVPKPSQRKVDSPKPNRCKQD